MAALSYKWLVGLSDFQRNLRFDLKLVDSVIELRKKADFLSVFFFNSRFPLVLVSYRQLSFEVGVLKPHKNIKH